MSAELIPPGARHQASPSRMLRDGALVLAVSALIGVVGGVVWELWWTPPTGLVLDHVWYPDMEGVRQLFTGTGLFAVVALAGGVLLGVICAWVFDRAELVTLGAVAVGSVIAAWLMYVVGTAMAPPDPTTAASTAVDYTELPGTLEVEGNGAFVAFPAGAMTGLAVVFIGVTPKRQLRQ